MTKTSHFDSLLPHVLRLASDHVKAGHESGHTDHGVGHWRQVAANGAMLASMTPGADAVVVECFAVIHDARRANEYKDVNHGPNGAKLAQELSEMGLLPVTGSRLAKLIEACRLHDTGAMSDDPTVACCYDADRMDLGRVGITPDARFFSTAAGRKAVS